MSPGSAQEAEAARSRLAFEELLVLQLRLLLQRTSAQCALAPLPCHSSPPGALHLHAARHLAWSVLI